MKATFTTAKGTEIELTAIYTTKEEISLDGHKTEIDCDKMIVNATMNGKIYTNIHLSNKTTILLGTIVQNGVTHPLMANIPETVYNTIYLDFENRQIAKLNKELSADRAYQENYNKVIKAMQE